MNNKFGHYPGKYAYGAQCTGERSWTVRKEKSKHKAEAFFFFFGKKHKYILYDYLSPTKTEYTFYPVFLLRSKG